MRTSRHTSVDKVVEKWRIACLLYPQSDPTTLCPPDLLGLHRLTQVMTSKTQFNGFEPVFSHSATM